MTVLWTLWIKRTSGRIILYPSNGTSSLSTSFCGTLSASPDTSTLRDEKTTFAPIMALPRWTSVSPSLLATFLDVTPSLWTSRMPSEDQFKSLIIVSGTELFTPIWCPISTTESSLRTWLFPSYSRILRQVDSPLSTSLQSTFLVCRLETRKRRRERGTSPEKSNGLGFGRSFG